MQTLSNENTPQVWTIIQVDPDKLIELGHRLKQHAMDFAKQGECLTVPLTEKILFVYQPESNMTKPEHKLKPTMNVANYTATEGTLEPWAN